MNCRKVSLFVAFLILWSINSFGQNCDCPAAASCGACRGGLSSLTFRFDGAEASVVVIEDRNEIFNATVVSGGTFTIDGSENNGKFSGPTLTIMVNGEENATLQTGCGGDTFVGSVYGSFTVNAGASVDGGPLCCLPELVDQDPPVIENCPATITQTLTDGCTATVTWTPPTASDNCSVASFTGTHQPGSNFQVGTTSIVYTAVDNYGNTSTCSFDVVITDNTIPVFTGCPANIIVSPDANCKATVSWTAPVATDNCLSTTTSNHNPGDEFNAGTTTVTYTARDASGNEATCSFTVTVQDTAAPVFSNCPSNITVVPLLNCKINVLWIPPSVTDNCGATVTSTHIPGSEFSAGTTTVTYTATDNAGNTAVCSFTVTVTDTSNPVFITCPTNITRSANATCKAVVNWPAPGVVDNCGAPVVTSTHTSGSEFSIGTTMITYTATDAAGNKATCSFTVTVNDTSAPMFSNCPTNITVSPTANCKAIVNWTAPAANDNCGIPTIVANYNPGSEFNAGTTTVTYSATDAAGNKATCSFTVTVKDTTVPEFANCPSNMTISPAANCKAIVNWTAPSITDNCSIVNNTASHTSGSEFSVGTTTVTYTATDAAGNKATCSFSVIVKDTTLPVFTNCPSNISVSPTANCKAIVNWAAPLASDNCGVATTTSTHKSGSEFSVGSTTVTYTATDTYGNKATCAFIVTVLDNSAPVFSSCPTNITVAATANCKARVTWTAPVATDNCGVVSKTNSHNPGTEFTVGTTTVTYSATDANGNTTKCEFNVTVTYSQTIMVNNCPAPIEVVADDFDSAKVTWDEPAFTLQCGTLYIEKNFESGTNFKTGETEVKYTASDRAGNSSTCTFLVTVKPNPLFTEPDIQISKLMTPDGDGYNDFLNIANLENYPDNSVTIVDRWGSVLFETSRYDNKMNVWRGLNKNNVLVPTGTYFYFVQINYADKRMKREGFIELIQ